MSQPGCHRGRTMEHNEGARQRSYKGSMQRKERICKAGPVIAPEIAERNHITPFPSLLCPSLGRGYFKLQKKLAAEKDALDATGEQMLCPKASTAAEDGSALPLAEPLEASKWRCRTLTLSRQSSKQSPSTVTTSATADRRATCVDIDDCARDLLIVSPWKMEVHPRLSIIACDNKEKCEHNSEIQWEHGSCSTEAPSDEEQMSFQGSSIPGPTTPVKAPRALEKILRAPVVRTPPPPRTPPQMMGAPVHKTQAEPPRESTTYVGGSAGCQVM